MVFFLLNILAMAASSGAALLAWKSGDHEWAAIFVLVFTGNGICACILFRKFLTSTNQAKEAKPHA